MWNLSTSTMKFMNHIKYSEKGTSFPFCFIIHTNSQVAGYFIGIETSPDGKYLAIIKRHDKGDYISIYHANSYILLQRFELDLVDVENIKWSPNNMYIIAWDNCLYVSSLNIVHENEKKGIISFVYDTQHKASVYRQDGFLVKSYSGYEYGLGIKSVHWSPNSLVIALGNFDDTVSFSIISSMDHFFKCLSNQLDTLVIHIVLGTDWYFDTSHHIECFRRDGTWSE